MTLLQGLCHPVQDREPELVNAIASMPGQTNGACSIDQRQDIRRVCKLCPMLPYSVAGNE